MNASVSVKGLVRKYDRVTAVDGLDLEVRAGECFGLLGPNGAGKTTTIEVIVGLIPPTAGEVRVLGRRWGEDDGTLRSRIGVALQETRFADRLTVREVVSLFRSFHPRGREPREVIREVGLGEKTETWTSRLSGGQRQRLSLACALVGDPDLLVLDEPTTGLDPQARRRMGDTIRSHRDRGRAILVSTHYMDEAQRLCDRVAVIDRGKVIALGTPSSLIDSLGGELVVEFVLSAGEVDESELLKVTGVRSVRRYDGAYHVTAGEGHATVPELLERLRGRGATAGRMTIRHATLEDVYVTLTGRQLRDE
ncbi:MAG TPA: ABC transporter ATP-binding protein [Candidatus Deferrimicrobiaceae bacterium]